MREDKVTEIISVAVGDLNFDLCSEVLVRIIVDLCKELESHGRDIEIVLRDIAMNATK